MDRPSLLELIKQCSFRAASLSQKENEVVFILKQIDAFAVRVVGKFESFEEAFAAKEAVYAKNEFMECFIDIVAPEGFRVGSLGEEA